MRKLLPIFAILVGLLCLISANPASADKPPEEHKVTICHRTNSDTNPYVQITVDIDAVDGEQNSDHYGEHVGPIWNDTLKAQKIEWGDIIPPVDPYHDGLNWTEEGQAVYANGCDFEHEATTTTTVEETTTTTEGTTTTVKIDGSSTTVDDNVVARRAQRVSELPRTGAGTEALTYLGSGLILAGLASSVYYRRALTR